MSPKRADGDVRSSVWLRALQAQARRVSWQPSRTFAVEVEEQPSGDIVRALVDGVTDLGALADNIPVHGLTITLSQTDELVLLCAGTHPLAHHRRIDFKDCLVHDIVGLSCGSSLLALTSRAAEQAGQQAVSIARGKCLDGDRWDAHR